MALNFAIDRFSDVGVVDKLFIEIEAEALLLALEGPALGAMYAGLVHKLEGTVAFDVGLCVVILQLEASLFISW